MASVEALTPNMMSSALETSGESFDEQVGVISRQIIETSG